MSAEEEGLALANAAEEEDAEEAKLPRSLVPSCPEEVKVQEMLDIARRHIGQHEGRPAARAATAALKFCKKANSGKGAKAEFTVTSLLALAEASLLIIVDGHSAVYRDIRTQRELDHAAIRALDAVTQASEICDGDNDFEDEEEDLPADKLVLYEDSKRQTVQDPRVQAQTYYWKARVLSIFQGKEAEALQAAGQARYIYEKIGDPIAQAEALLIMAQAHHKMDPGAAWATNAAHEALELYSKEKDEEGKDRTFELFQELGLVLRVAGVAGGSMAALPAAGAAPAAGAPAAAAAESVVEAPKGLDPEMVMHSVQEMAKAAIGLDEELTLDSPLMDSGMDSLTAVSFRNGLQQNLGVKLPSSLMFDYPTMREVGNRIVELSLEDE